MDWQMLALLWPQAIADGLILGALVGLGAIGVTLTFGILRFANFTHGEFMAVGAYAALAAAGFFAAATGITDRFGGLSFGWPLVFGLLMAVVIAAGLAVILGEGYLGPLGRTGVAITLVIGSFGASLLLRNTLILGYGADPLYFSREIQIAQRFWPGIRLTPDQIAVLGAAVVATVALFVFLTRTRTGKAMRATAENPALAQCCGIDVKGIVRLTWIIGAGLAALGGVGFGLVAQIRPSMGFDLLLPLFAAVILGGIGSVAGALVGGLVIGLTESLSVLLIGPQWRTAVAFLVLIGLLMVRPQGLFGGRA